ncbi:conserved hypothetical protein [Histoplasma capsulatum G186AR]|uniref:Uncharacterized protein n=1 Tax=Ajellomyces capsulatus (strain G186AR / H82 / ATCC MYA-2454 / RMSCC 2432) TaxID=447093 RepID=C0NQ28_AJECG|nr:uncharacterized protein HCBG_05258 [Histoplasma capsulatum G186AR]EEH07038.1 conserved hypothetical protein [Histoplasma capsulatum G186AR]
MTVMGMPCLHWHPTVGHKFHISVPMFSILCTAIWTLTSNSWKDALPADIYLEESLHLMTVPLAKDGGMTQWVLVDKNLPRERRPLLASCETFRKRSWVSDKYGNVAEFITHGVASVYCDPRYRGRGYASRLMKELAEVLPKWQTAKTKECIASVLFSDIGRRFYTNLKWYAFPSYHVEFPPWVPSAGASPTATPLFAGDLAKLCKQDEALALKTMATPRPYNEKTRFMIVPDHDHMLWHHAKEEFAAKVLLNLQPQVKGAISGERGNRIWAIWTHRFYESPQNTISNNTLYILRLVIENQNALNNITVKYDLQVAGLRAVILAAQKEAAEWNLEYVKLWSPSPQVQELIKQTGIAYRGEDREEEGICSLRWFGKKGDTAPAVEWVGNEKYGWC